MSTQGVREYLFAGLEATPVVLEVLLSDLSSDDPRWDYEHNEARFTLREMAAHIADWEPIFRSRIEKVLHEDHPFLNSVDEGKLAEERDYAHQDPRSNIDRFTDSRAELVEFIRQLPLESWDRTGHRETIGDVSLTDLVSIILGHDAYHLRQVADYLTS